ncbi:MAG TPA: hypothetical protein DEF41_13080 [Desulfovibrio sp.]|nr:hypothetical protein [Desulfovibrio sp.]
MAEPVTQRPGLPCENDKNTKVGSSGSLASDLD